jgi:hypothetical protein
MVAPPMARDEGHPPKERIDMNTEAIALDVGVQQDLPKEEKKDKGLVIAGWVFAFLMPIVGFFVGLAAAIRGRAGHGVAIMATSVLVTVVVAMLLIGSAASSVDKSLADAQAQVEQTTTPPSGKATHAAPKPGAISFNQYRSVKTGMSKSEVKSLLGKPSDITRDETDLGELGGVIKTEMWSYDNRGGSAMDLNGFMFTFTNGKLDSKSSL